MKTNLQVYCFGESLLRLQTKKNINYLEEFKVFVGGAEVNVCIGLANLKHNTYMLSILPKNFLANYLEQYLNRFRINTTYFAKANLGNQGVYYVEKGQNLVKSTVTYDRKYSAFAQNPYLEKPFLKANKGDFLHISGSSLLVSELAFKNALSLAKEAKSKGMLISFDFNYRAKLGDYKKAYQYFEPLLKLADLIFATKLDFVNIFKYDAKLEEENIIKQVIQDYDLKWVAHTNRKINNNTHQLQGVFYTKKEKITTNFYTFDVDERIGGGDAFATGIIDGLILNFSTKKMLENSIKLAIYKQTLLKEDHLLITRSDLDDFNIDNTNQDVKR